MNFTSKDIVSKFVYLRANPNAMQRLVLDIQETISNGEHIVYDPTTPFANVIESMCTIGAAFMTQAESIVRQQYGANASNPEELYLHMSDADFLNRFSSPATGDVMLLMSLDEIKAKAVTVPGNNGLKRLTIPRHTEFSIGNYIFTMQYPIDIDVWPTGSISVYYNTDKPSPLYSLENDRVNWFIGGYGLNSFVGMTISAKQIYINSQIATLNGVNGLYKEYTYADKFHYARAFIKNRNDSEWVEIKTTHTEQVYDANTPTAVLKVLEGVLAVRVPQIYFNNGSIKDSLRVDIYTTKGAIDVNLSSINPDSIIVNWNDYDRVGNDIYTAPLATFSGLTKLMENPVNGGSNGLTFTELRDKVITNGLANPTKPITDEQLDTALDALGYNIVANVDNITDRQYLAVRELPAPDNLDTVTGAGCTVKMLQARLSDVVQQQTVENNGDRVTIKPNTLFRLKDGILSLVNDLERLALLNSANTTPDILANVVNESEFYYTPFYYVLDVTNNIFDTRVYRLDNPTVLSKYLYAENNSMLVNGATKGYKISAKDTGDGYTLLVEASTTELYKSLPVGDIYLQLSYLPPSSNQRVYINGNLIVPIDSGTGRPVDDRYIYSFDLNTKFDIDASHLLLLEDTQSPMNLTTEFDLVYFVKDYVPSGASASDIDNIVNPEILDDYNSSSIYRGFTHEKVKIKVGDYLEKLWTRSRSVVEDTKYETYTADVPMVYTEKVYERNVDGTLKLVWDPLAEQLNANLLHDVGDPVLDSNAQPIMRYIAGDVKLDFDGNPIPLAGTKGMLRQFDLFLVDGRYFFATNTETISYRQEIVNLVTDMVVNDLVSISNRLLERSELFFYPKVTSGVIDVIVNNQEKVQIKADQTFKVTYYVRQDVYENEAVKAAIEKRTAKVISQALNTTTISVLMLTEALKSAAGDDILSVSLNGFTNDVYDTITLADLSVKPVVGKRLTALSNKTLSVQDAIVVNFVNHLPRTA